ncbi:hypothetical protein ACWD4G_43710 [Streptomyces sp. NPDC002643]
MPAPCPLGARPNTHPDAHPNTHPDAHPDTVAVPPSPRAANVRRALAFAEHGVRASVVRLAPAVHDETKRGLIGQLSDLAREKGVSGYVGDGSNRWTAVHRLDAARLFRLALEEAPAGSVWHGVAEEGIPLRAVAERIAQHLGIPATTVRPERAPAHFGFLATLLGRDLPVSSALTHARLDWHPDRPTPLDDLAEGHLPGSAQQPHPAVQGRGALSTCGSAARARSAALNPRPPTSPHPRAIRCPA